jgi:hypothetical protein
MQFIKMTTLAEPKSVDELVEFIAQATKDHFERTGRGVDGSVLAYLVKDKYPGLSYVKLGLSKLGDAVRLGEQRKLISRNPDAKHLEVRPAQTTPFPVASTSSQSSRDLFVAPELWRAAVLSRPDAHSFIHRSTGEVAQAAPGDLERKRADDSYVEIDTISERAQLQWLQEFLKTKGWPEQIEHDEGHLRILLRSRTGFDPPTARDWKYFRARKAVEHIKQWAVRSRIPESFVLEPPKSKDQSTASRRPSQQHAAGAEEALRTATLAAISEMTLEELGKLRVPLELVYRHFAPK